jgi:hypothetical protein
MKCGDKGHRTATGAPCQQNIAPAAKGCLWHGSKPEERKLLSLRGNVMATLRRALPKDHQMVPFDSRESVIRFAEDLARRVLTEDVDPRRVDTALRAAGVALSGFAAATQEKLVEALLKIEHGGVAFAWLSRIQEGLQGAAPLPTRLRALAPPVGDAS